MTRLFASPVDLSHELVSRVVQEGDKVVDATAGNGKDSLFLARLVGNRGKVFAFDIQQEAVANTLQLLDKEGKRENVQVIHHGHQCMGKYVPCKVRAVMFNLGYLPGGSKNSILTRPCTTLAAIEAALNLLLPGGLVSLVIYRGHEGGQEENEQIKKLVADLPRSEWDVLSCDFPNRKVTSPYLLGIQSRVVKI